MIRKEHWMIRFWSEFNQYLGEENLWAKITMTTNLVDIVELRSFVGFKNFWEKNRNND